MRLLVNDDSSLCVRLGGMSDFVSVKRYIRIINTEIGKIIAVHFPIEFDADKKMWRYRGQALVQFLNPHEAVRAARKDAPRPDLDWHDRDPCKPGSFYDCRGKNLRVEEKPVQKEFDIQQLYDLQKSILDGKMRWTGGVPRVSPTADLGELCYEAEGFDVPPAKWPIDGSCTWAV